MNTAVQYGPIGQVLITHCFSFGWLGLLLVQVWCSAVRDTGKFIFNVCVYFIYHTLCR